MRSSMRFGNISFYDRVHDLNVEIGSEMRKVDAK